MAYQPLDLGTIDNDGTGDPLKDGGVKINANFAELYGLLPIGTAPAVGAVANGDFCQLYGVAGVLKIRKADADDTTKPANCFVKVGGADADTLTWYGLGLVNDALAGLTPGATYYLSTVAGGVTDTIPASSLNGQQELGAAISATAIATVRLPMLEAP